MTMPNLYDVFFNNDFTDEMIPELNEARSKRKNISEKLDKTYHITFADSEALERACYKESVSAQYMGFLQGFKWAAYLLTGHIEEECQ